MPKILDAIGKDKINRFTLSFKDAVMEKSYLEEYNKKLAQIMIKQAKIGLIATLFVSIIFRMLRDGMDFHMM